MIQNVLICLDQHGVEFSEQFFLLQLSRIDTGHPVNFLGNPHRGDFITQIDQSEDGGPVGSRVSACDQQCSGKIPPLSLHLF